MLCATHTASEIEEMLNEHQIPCSQVISFQDMLTHEHYLARQSLIPTPSTRWEDPENPGQPLNVMVPNIVPKAKNNPLSIWRAGVDLGFDTKDILEDLGYSAEEVQAFFDEGVSVVKKDYCPQFKHL